MMDKTFILSLAMAELAKKRHTSEFILFSLNFGNRKTYKENISLDIAYEKLPDTSCITTSFKKKRCHVMYLQN